MGDASNVVTAVGAYQKLGALDFLILLLAIAFCVFVWRIIAAQDKIALTLDSLFAKSDVMCNSLAAHDRQAQDMSDNLESGVQCLTHIKTGIARIEGRLKI
jgi:hypothetical protein